MLMKNWIATATIAAHSTVRPRFEATNGQMTYSPEPSAVATRTTPGPMTLRSGGASGRSLSGTAGRTLSGMSGETLVSCAPPGSTAMLPWVPRQGGVMQDVVRSAP
jgi:hypothetical protein